MFDRVLYYLDGLTNKELTELFCDVFTSRKTVSGLCTYLLFFCLIPFFLSYSRQ